MQQTRLAHARLGNKVNDAEFRARLVEPALKYLQFVFASQALAEPDAGPCVQRQVAGLIRSIWPRSQTGRYL